MVWDRGDRQAFAINKIYWPRDVELFYRCGGQEKNVSCQLAATPTPTMTWKSPDSEMRREAIRYNYGSNGRTRLISANYHSLL